MSTSTKTATVIIAATQGATGSQGPIGRTGDTGATGAKGDQGIQGVPGDVTLTQVQEIVNTALPASRNLLDMSRATAGIVWAGVHHQYESSPGRYFSDYIPVTPGQSFCFAQPNIDNNAGQGWVFYDATKTEIFSSFHAVPFTTGPFTVPAGAAYFRFPIRGDQTSTQMMVFGTTPPTLYSAFQQPPSTTALRSPWNGKVLGVWGDSITLNYSSQWVKGVAAYHNMSIGFMDARTGRHVSEIFENYAGSPLTSTGATATGGMTSGTTIAQDMASVDLCLVYLGTNDYAVTMGTIADTSTTASFYGYVRKAIETLLTAKPTMRLVWVAPYNVQTASYHPYMRGIGEALVDVCAEYGVPVINLYKLSGIGPMTWAVFTETGLPNIHPQVLGMTKAIIPTISTALNQLG